MGLWTYIKHLFWGVPNHDNSGGAGAISGWPQNTASHKSNQRSSNLTPDVNSRGMVSNESYPAQNSADNVHQRISRIANDFQDRAQAQDLDRARDFKFLMQEIDALKKKIQLLESKLNHDDLSHRTNTHRKGFETEGASSGTNMYKTGYGVPGKPEIALFFERGAQILSNYLSQNTAADSQIRKESDAISAQWVKIAEAYVKKRQQMLEEAPAEENDSLDSPEKIREVGDILLNWMLGLLDRMGELPESVLTQDKKNEILKYHHVTVIKPERGGRFIPEQHELTEFIPDSSNSNLIDRCVQSGYKYKTYVLRKARVVARL